MSSTNSIAVDSSPRARILVIDDDSSIRGLLVGVLSRNYIVTAAPDGETGFHQAKADPPNIVVIDIQMPGWDGLRTLGEFRKDPQLTQVATIILTADASRDTVLAAIQAGADDYVIKTAFSREDFERKIRRLLHRYPIAPKPSESIPTPTIQAPETDHSMGVGASTDPEIPNVITPPPTPLNTAATQTGGSGIQELLDAWE